MQKQIQKKYSVFPKDIISLTLLGKDWSKLMKKAISKTAPVWHMMYMEAERRLYISQGLHGGPV